MRFGEVLVHALLIQYQLLVAEFDRLPIVERNGFHLLLAQCANAHLRLEVFWFCLLVQRILQVGRLYRLLLCVRANGGIRLVLILLFLCLFLWLGRSHQ